MNQAYYNPNLVTLEKSFREGKRGVVMEGSSRSGKTWSAIDFIIWLCSTFDNTTINIVKETYNGFKTTLYDDFDRRLGMYPHLGKYNPFQRLKEVQSFKIFGNKINLIGADQPSKFHGAGCDFFYINEAIPVQQAIFDQLEMRCRRFWFIDYNPSVSDHWIFNRLGKRDDVVFFHSTMLNNPYISFWEKKKIQGYEPTPENIEAGTADDYMWNVYGLGLRASPQGLIFPNVTWIDEFPDDVEEVNYGMDFGHTNSPTAIAKVGKNGQNIYLEKLFYFPCDDPKTLSEIIKKLIGDNHIWADSAEPGMIADLRLKGIVCLAVKKFPGSIIYGIDLMKQFKIHIVRDPDFRREQENYKWREVNGIRLNEPVKEFDHIWDSCRYACLSEYRLSESPPFVSGRMVFPFGGY